MTTFNEANQARLSLKMLLSSYAWYHSSVVTAEGGDFIILVHTLHIDNNVRKVIPIVHLGTSVRADVVPSKS